MPDPDRLKLEIRSMRARLKLLEVRAELLAAHRRATDPTVSARRTPAAGEVLPPEQRATWARGRTPYDK